MRETLKMNKSNDIERNYTTFFFLFPLHKQWAIGKKFLLVKAECYQQQKNVPSCALASFSCEPKEKVHEVT